MPTIKQLPTATSVGATDLLPLSQGGTTRALPVGSLLSSVQTAISVAPSTLLGRVSATAGGPESVGIGAGLTISLGAVAATAADHIQLPISPGLQPGDEVVVNSSGVAKRMPATSLRTLFIGGSGITIDGTGTIAATGGPGFAGVSTFNARSGPITLTSADLSGAGGALAASLPQGAISPPLASGAAAVGSSPFYARQDHVHPTDGTRLAAASNLADLASPVAARTSLGLGNAATLSVGAVAGTLAAGDDSRILGAQPAATLGAAMITASGASAARSLSARAADMVSAKDFGAVGNGVADDTAAINAALASGRAVYLPAGTYLCSGTLLVAGTALAGEARGLVTLTMTSNGDVVQLSGQYPRLAGVTVNAGSGHAAGYGIHVMPATFGAEVERVAFTGVHPAAGLLLDNCADTALKQVEFRYPVPGTPGTLSAGPAVWIANNAVDTFLDDINTYAWSVGLQVSYGSGVYAQRIDAVQGTYGVLVNPLAGQHVFGAFFSEVLADSNASHGWYFTGAGAITDVTINGSWASNNFGSGFRLDNPNLNALSVAQSQIIGSRSHGVDIESGKNIALIGNQVTVNGLATPGSYDGVYVATGADQVRVSGNFIGLGGTFAAPPISAANGQRYGVNGASTAPGDTRGLIVVGNQMPGNLTAALNLPTAAGIVQVGNSDGNGLLGGIYATAASPSLTGNVKITGDGTAPNAYLRVSASDFQVCSSDLSTVLLNLTPNSDLSTNRSLASAAINVQAETVTRWSWSGGDALGLQAFNASGAALGTVLSVGSATEVVTFLQTPVVPTAAPGTNTTQVATTAFVASAVQGTGVLVTSGATYDMQPPDRFVVVRKATGSATAITLPPAPSSWSAYVVKDGKGDASNNNITISAAVPIDGMNSFIINQSYESVTLIFNGVDWSIV